MPIFRCSSDALYLDSRFSVVVSRGGLVATGIVHEVHADLTNPASDYSGCWGPGAYSLGPAHIRGLKPLDSMPVMATAMATAKRTMRYMAFSLAFTASGLILAYLLWHPHPGRDAQPGAGGDFVGDGLPRTLAWHGFVFVTLLSGAALIVAGQAGFIDGSRAGQYGPRLLDALLVLQPLRASGHPQRHPVDGLGGPTAMYAKATYAGDHVLDQRAFTFSLSRSACAYWFMVCENPLCRGVWLLLPGRSGVCRFWW